jgi:SWIM/SEC-C metal-binding protein
MHNLYYKGRIYTRENHVKTGVSSDRPGKLGTVKNPLTLVVNSDDRKIELEKLVAEHEASANITVDSAVDENIIELDAIVNKLTTTRSAKTLNRNDPCSCDSGKKYKKCCG